MALLSMTDAEILPAAVPMLKDIFAGTNSKDWEQFSRHMSESKASNSVIRADVEKQWEECEWLTSLSKTPEFLGIIRRENGVMTLWRQTSSKSDEEYLQKLVLVGSESEIKQSGIWLE